MSKGNLMHRTFPVALVALVLGTGSAFAQAQIFYPSKGQSTQQEQQDEGECHVWAKQKTGVNPAEVASAPPGTQGAATGGGERLRGSARGAAGGAAIGAIAGDASKGAAAGAVVGTMSGGRQARQNKGQQQQQAAQAQSNAITPYYKAMAACMEGRGYVVK
jgi:hypothetical protein